MHTHTHTKWRLGERELSNVGHGDCSGFSGFELKAMGTVNSPPHHHQVPSQV